MRRLLGMLLRTDGDLNAFCLDYLADVHNRFSESMDRLQKTNLLLSLHEPEEILLRLQERFLPDPSALATIALLLSKPTSEDARQTRKQWDVLDSLYMQRETLIREGQSTASVDQKLVAIKRAQRQTSQVQEGTVLGERYRLIEIIGRGGFAKVWHAFDLRLKRSVAVKILHSDQGDEVRRVERFERGARQMQALEHPHIVRVLDGPSEDQGFHYFVMELLAGSDLSRALVTGKIDQQAALRAVLQVGMALEYAHQRGLIHRDVKPQNILLDELGKAFLTDFDLVWAPDTTGGTRTGAMGTFLYAAPEEMEDASRVDHRVDIYSLGMTIIFVLYGKALSRKVLDARLLFIDELDCTESAKALLRHATAPDPEDRPATVAELCQDLLHTTYITSEWGEPLRHTEPPSSRVTLLPSQTSLPVAVLSSPPDRIRLVSSRPWYRGIAGGGLLVLACLVGMWRYSAWRNDRRQTTQVPDLGSRENFLSSGAATALDGGNTVPGTTTSPGTVAVANREAVSGPERTINLAGRGLLQPTPRQSPRKSAEAKPRKSSANTAQGEGYLIANTHPWAKIFIDNKDSGKTTPIGPRDRIPLKAGKHIATFVTNDKRLSIEVIIHPGEVAKIVRNLDDAKEGVSYEKIFK